MAKTKAAPTQAQIAAKAAREAYSTAKDKAGDKPNASIQANLDKLKAAMNTAVKAENRERFLRVAPARARKAANMIEGLTKALSAKGYEFTKEEAEKLLNGIQKRLDAAKAKLASPGAATQSATDEFAL